MESGELYVEVGRRIRQVREERGLSQDALAGLVSLTRTSITNIEKGRQRILLHTLVELATALKVSPSSLLPAENASDELDAILARYPTDEEQWIRSAVESVRRKE